MFPLRFVEGLATELPSPSPAAASSYPDWLTNTLSIPTFLIPPVAKQLNVISRVHNSICLEHYTYSLTRYLWLFLGAADCLSPDRIKEHTQYRDWVLSFGCRVLAYTKSLGLYQSFSGLTRPTRINDIQRAAHIQRSKRDNKKSPTGLKYLHERSIDICIKRYEGKYHRENNVGLVLGVKRSCRWMVWLNISKHAK